MNEDENKEETSEVPVPEEAGTVEDAAPPDAEGAEAGGSGQPTAEEQPAAEQPDEKEQPDEPAAAGENEGESAGHESSAGPKDPAEQAEGGVQGDRAPAQSGDREPASSEKEKDLIPGADLEPIAVETDERPLSAEERARLEAEEEERASREAELAGEGAEEESEVASRAPAKMESGSRYMATGKRKRSIARVTLLPGGGEIQINGRELEEFFPRPLHQTMARQPLTTTGYEASVDVRVRVHGGGVGGQAGAVRHGIARALTEIDPELRGELKRRGFLTRDARVKERRKAGLKKARKRPQFSKR